jgi:hypothetical protein
LFVQMISPPSTAAVGQRDIPSRAKSSCPKAPALFDTPGLRIDPLGTLNAPLLHGETSASPQVTQNDIVVLAGERGNWQVVAPVNGRKVDIRRREGFDIRVVTAVLENLTVVQYAGSPGCSY